MRYLIDTSALVRILRRQVPAGWYDRVDRGQVAICEPVVVEALAAAEAARYREVEAGLRGTYPTVPVPDNAWQLVRTLRQALAEHGAHHGLSVADYLVAATALRLDVTVLHEDAAFETVARVVPQLRQERLAPSPRPAGAVSRSG